MSGVRRYAVSYLFIAPFFLLFLVFGLIPVLFTFFLAFVNWDGFGAMKYVAFENFVALARDQTFWLSLENTIVLWLGHIFVMLALALLAAVGLNSRQVVGTGILRAIYYMPNAVSVVPMGLAFGLVFDQNFGILNLLLAKLGAPLIPWLSDGTWAKVSVIIVNIWRVTGWYMVIFLAGLQGLDPQLYESAAIDGASRYRMLTQITIPMMQRIIAFAFVIETIGSLRIFTEPYILTKFGPANATLPMLGYLYSTAFEFLKLGYASAIGFVLFVVIAVVSYTQLKLFERGGAE